MVKLVSMMGLRRLTLRAVVARVDEIVARHPEAAAYTPGAIL